MEFTKIIIPTTPHPDVLVGIFLLKSFGEAKYPGIGGALVEILQELPAGETALSLESKGVLVLDLSGGTFDHHGKDAHLSKLIAQELGIETDLALAKLLSYTERDDKFGLGTISNDQLDKAFGLSGLIAALNKTERDPNKVVSAVFPLLQAHYTEEKKRTIELPAEFEKQLKEGRAEVFEVKHKGVPVKIAVLESDNVSMAGWLKSSIGIKADMVCQRMSSGHTNIMTKQQRNLDLGWLAAYVRNDEFQMQEKDLAYSFEQLKAPGRITEIPEWYYDTATNSLLNGGVNPKGVSPTLISLGRMKHIIKDSLSRTVQEN
jgi:hypothetical protein